MEGIETLRLGHVNVVLRPGSINYSILMQTAAALSGVYI